MSAQLKKKPDRCKPMFIKACVDINQRYADADVIEGLYAYLKANKPTIYAQILALEKSLDDIWMNESPNIKDFRSVLAIWYRLHLGVIEARKTNGA